MTEECERDSPVDALPSVESGRGRPRKIENWSSPVNLKPGGALTSSTTGLWIRGSGEYQLCGGMYGFGTDGLFVISATLIGQQV